MQVKGDNTENKINLPHSTNKEPVQINGSHINSCAIKNSEPRLTITHQEYNCDESNIKITLTDDFGISIKTTASQIAKNLRLINSLSNEDAMRIGYIASFEQCNLMDS